MSSQRTSPAHQKPTHMLGLFSTTESASGSQHVYCALFSRNPNDPSHLVYQPVDYTGFDMRFDPKNSAERAWFMPISSQGATALLNQLDLLRMSSVPHSSSMIVGANRKALHGPVHAFGQPERADDFRQNIPQTGDAALDAMLSDAHQGHSPKDDVDRIFTNCRRFTLSNLIHHLGIPLNQMDAGLTPDAQILGFPAAFKRLMDAHQPTPISLTPSYLGERQFDQAIIPMQGGAQSVMFVPHNTDKKISIGIPDEIESLNIRTPQGETSLMDFILGQTRCAESSTTSHMARFAANAAASGEITR